MSILDYIIIALIVILALRCMSIGFISEVMTKATFIGGLILGFLLFKPAGELLLSIFPVIGQFAPFLGFIAIYIVAAIIIHLLDSIITGLFESLKLGFINKLLGLILGALEAIIIVTILLIVINMIPFINELEIVSSTIESSVIASWLINIIREQDINLSLLLINQFDRA